MFIIYFNKSFIILSRLNILLLLICWVIKSQTMKKILFTTYILLGFQIILLAQETRIKFRKIENIEEIKQIATKENKNIFVYLHYQGCPHCVRMEKNIFPNVEVGNIYNKEFVCVSLDIYTDNIGDYLRSEYSPKGYPAYLFFNKKMELTNIEAGYKTIDEFITLRDNPNSNEKNTEYYKNRIIEGDISAETLRKYFKMPTYIPERDSLIKVYKSNCTTDELYSLESWKLLSENIYSKQSFQFIVDNEDKYRKTVGNEEVDSFLIEKWISRINRWSAWWGNDLKRAKMKRSLLENNHPLNERIIHQAEYMLKIDRASFKQKSKYKWRKMVSASNEYLKYGYNDWNNYYRASWLILNKYKKFGTHNDLKLGITLAEKSTTSHKEFMNMLIYAQLLNESGQKQKATNKMKEALELVNESCERKYIKWANESLKAWINE